MNYPMGRIEFRVDDELKSRFVALVGDASAYLRQCMVNAVDGAPVEVTHHSMVDVPKGRPAGKSVFGPDISRISDVPLFSGEHDDQELIKEEQLPLSDKGVHPSFDTLILNMQKDDTHTNNIIF